MDNLVASFSSLFAGRTDARGTQEGGCIREKVTPEHYEKHLKGDESLGIYPLLDDSTCYFFAVDLDEKDFNKAKAIRQELNNIFIPSYIACSRRKGYHIYGFAADGHFKAKEIRHVLNSVLNKLAIKAEIFPKQDMVSEQTPLGNYINLPSFGFTRPFLTTNMKEVKLELALSKIKRTPQESIERALQTLLKGETPEGKPTPVAECLGGRQDEKFNLMTIEKLLENCAFIQHCRDDAATLSEPHWWSLVCILVHFGEPGKQKFHELSQPYPEYTEKETDKKIKEAQKAGEKEISPHTCAFIEQSLGFPCPDECLAKKRGLKSPAVLATRLVTEGLHITIDGTTYLERLDPNRILSINHPKEDAPPVIKTLASFIIEPRMRITLDGEGERLDTLLKRWRGCASLLIQAGGMELQKTVLSCPTVGGPAVLCHRQGHSGYLGNGYQ